MSDGVFDLNASARAKEVLFDPIIEFFLKSGSDSIEVDVNGMDSNHIMTQLNKSIEEKSLEDRVRTELKNNIVFLALRNPATHASIVRKKS